MPTAKPEYLPAPADQAAILFHESGSTENALVIAYRVESDGDLTPITYPAAGTGDRVAMVTGPMTLHLHGTAREFSTVNDVMQFLGMI